MQIKNLINLKQFNLKTYIIMVIIIFTISIFLYQFEIIEHLELKSLDFRYKRRPTIEIHPEVGYISIDDESSELVGPWRPWSRDKQVILVETLGYFNTRLAGYDVFFVEDEKITLNLNKFRSFFDNLRKFSPYIDLTDNNIRNLIENEIETAFLQNDLLFQKALKEANNTYLGSYMLLSYEEDKDKIAEITKDIKNRASEEKREALKITSKQAIPLTETIEKKCEISDTIISIRKPLPGKEELYENIYKSVDIQVPIYNLTKTAKGIGFAQIVEIMDGIVRLFPVTIEYNDKAYLALSVLMALDIFEKDLSDIEIIPGEYFIIKDVKLDNSDEIIDLKIPISQTMQKLVNWSGGFDETFLHIPYSLLSYYYAFIFANNYLKDIPEIVTNYKIIYNALYSNFTGFSMVQTNEAEKLARNFTISHLLKNAILSNNFNDNFKNELLKFMGNDNETLTYLIDLSKLSIGFKNYYNKKNEIISYNELLSKTNVKDSIELHSAYNYLKWHAENNKLDKVSAYYYPETKIVNHNGELITFEAYDLENKIFLIGLTGAGTIDLNPMPFEESTPMVALHSNAVNMLLTNQFLNFPTWTWQYLSPLLAICLSVFITYILTSAGLAIIPNLIIFYIIYALSYNYYWNTKNTWVHLVVPLLSVTISYFTVVIYQFIQELKAKQKIRGIFSTMVSPTVLKLMEENPDKFSLTGERKAATMMFSLVKGFAKIMESSRPDELSSILSIYLTPTSEIIMDYGGYIDKYEGHIIMADFGVPLDDTDHFWKCSYAGIEQILDITSFKYFVQARFGIDVSTLMGINFGYISAGNMGSDQKFQYTVMGDAVNVAARFMPANLIYNTNIITGGDTYAKVKDYTQLRHLDKLLLKGKTKPTDIYEIVGWQPDVYYNLFKDANVPDSLLTRWLKAPPEKIIGYRLFWEEKYNDFNNNMSKNIFDFFVHNNDLTIKRIEIENEIEFLNYSIETDNLTDEINKITEKNFEKFNYSSDDWQDKLTKWNEYLKNILKEFVDFSKDSKMVLQTNEIDLINRLSVLTHKLNLNLDKLKYSRDIDNEIKSIYEKLKDFILRIDNSSFEKVLNTAIQYRTAYEKNVKVFYKNISSRRKEYFEMMSYVGSMNEKEKKLNEFYSKGMNEYWNRNWDEAINYFEKGKEYKPLDGPVNVMIERTKNFKEVPPGANWQGEFIQTKK